MRKYRPQRIPIRPRRPSVIFSWCSMCGKRNEEYRVACIACGTYLGSPLTEKELAKRNEPCKG